MRTERGVVHRDVKPGNILLPGNVALLADFGIARAIGLAGGERLTRSGIRLGTPYYMSPEQAYSGHQVSAAADQYSLACVLYELLTGSPPFPGETARLVFLSHAVDAIPSVLVQVPSLPPGLDAVVRKGSSKLPESRYPSFREFGEAAVAASRD
jgi:serine/threonine-protein kinase